MFNYLWKIARPTVDVQKLFTSVIFPSSEIGPVVFRTMMQHTLKHDQIRLQICYVVKEAIEILTEPFVQQILLQIQTL